MFCSNQQLSRLVNIMRDLPGPGPGTAMQIKCGATGGAGPWRLDWGEVMVCCALFVSLLINLLVCSLETNSPDR